MLQGIKCIKVNRKCKKLEYSQFKDINKFQFVISYYSIIKLLLEIHIRVDAITN